MQINGRLVDIPNFMTSNAMALNTATSNKRVSPQSNTRINPDNMGKLDFKNLLSRSTPSKSDNEIKEAIRLQAQEDAASGVFQGSNFHDLKDSFISVVSPDRIGIISNKISLLSFLWNNGNSRFSFSDGDMLIAKFSPEQGWLAVGTDAEFARSKEIAQIYNEAWNAARFGTGGDRSSAIGSIEVGSSFDFKV